MTPIRNQAKANAARLRAAAASLDPRIRISLADGKGTHEWRNAGQLPRRRSGPGVRTEVVEHLIRVLGELPEELGAPQGRPATPRRRRRRRRRRRT